MATNFTIQARHSVKQLRLELAGDFDASSAMQLLYRLAVISQGSLPQNSN